MSAFTDFVDKPILESPIVLVEIDLDERQDFWIPHEAGIWKIALTDLRDGIDFNFQNGWFCYGSFENSGTDSTLGINPIIKIIQSLDIAGEQYTQVTTVSNLRSTNKSFLYDGGTTILYVHFDGFTPPDVNGVIKIGVTNGFSTRDLYLSDIFYQGKVASLPKLRIEKDPLFWKLLRFTEDRVSFFNEDGYFDAFAKGGIYGQPARVKFGGAALDFADFLQLFAGYIETFSIDESRFEISIADNRKRLTRSVPINVWDATTYPNIKPSNIGKPIPIAYGRIKNAPVVCTNEAETGTPATYSFKICDTTDHAIDAITTVYVNAVEVTPDSTNLATATFVLLTADYDPGDDVTCDFTGYEDGGGDPIENGLDVIVDLLAVFEDVTYSTDTFDTTEWAAEQATAYDINIFIDRRTELLKVIEEISASLFGSLVVTNDNKYTFKVPDHDAASVMTIAQDEIFEQAIEYQTDKFLTSVVVKYAEDYAEDEFTDYPDTSREAAIYAVYARYRDEEFETKLTDEADAIALASRLMDVAEEIPTVFRITTSMRASTLEIVDNIVAQIDRIVATWYGQQKCEVIGIEYDLDSFKITLDLWRIEDAV